MSTEYYPYFIHLSIFYPFGQIAINKFEEALHPEIGRAHV